MDQLVARYKELGLPLPPDNAKLVLFASGWRTIAADKTETVHHAIGFLLPTKDAGKPNRVLVGTYLHQFGNRKPKFTYVDPERADLTNVTAEWTEPPFEINAGLATAIACHARGHVKLARDLVAKSLASNAGHHFSAFYQPANLPPQKALAHLAWAHWANELVTPDTDRAAIAKRLKALVKAEPSLDTDSSKWLLRSLAATLKPSSAKHGSARALIDCLTELSSHSQALLGEDLAADSAAKKLIEMGFDAVPALIEHLDDERLTRSVQTGFNNFPSWPRQVGHVVSDLLQGLAGEDARRDWLDRQRGSFLDKDVVKTWWKKAQSSGEEQYLLDHVMGSEDSQHPSQQMLRVIVVKYSGRLPTIYRNLLRDRPEMQSYDVIEALKESSLPRAEKLVLLLEGARHKNLEQRRFAIWAIKDLDPERFITLLVENLNSLPATPKEPYWRSPEAAMAHLVIDTPDPRAWKALAAAAKRVDVGLRLELMNPMNYSYIGEDRKRERLTFLGGFIDDTALRDEATNSELFDGPSAAFTIPKIRVCDFAAMQIASILNMSHEPTDKWSVDQWDSFRAAVRKKLEKHFNR